MKVLAFNGSPRKKGNTLQLIQKAFEPLQAAGHDCEVIQAGGVLLHGCKGCGYCRTEKGKGTCVQKDDPMNDWIKKMVEADVILLASPTYFANMTPEIKCIIDRAGYVAKSDFKHKIGAPIVAARRGGAIQVYNSMMSFFGITEMIVPMSSYWNVGIGLKEGDVQNDAEGMQTMENLGNNIAWLLDKISK